MVLKVSSLNLPHKTLQRLKGHEPQKWIGRIWNWDKSHRNNNLIKLLKVVVKNNELKNEPQAQELAKSVYNKINERKKDLSKTEKSHFKKLEKKYDKFTSTKPKNDLPPVQHQQEPDICPITLDEIKDPVVTPCGHKFEKTAIERWLIDHWECPVDRNPLFAYQLKQV